MLEICTMLDPIPFLRFHFEIISHERILIVFLWRIHQIFLKCNRMKFCKRPRQMSSHFNSDRLVTNIFLY